jgi:hypothetical protein
MMGLKMDLKVKEQNPQLQHIPQPIMLRVKLRHSKIRIFDQIMVSYYVNIQHGL